LADLTISQHRAAALAALTRGEQHAASSPNRLGFLMEAQVHATLALSAPAAPVAELASAPAPEPTPAEEAPASEPTPKPATRRPRRVTPTPKETSAA